MKNYGISKTWNHILRPSLLPELERSEYFYFQLHILTASVEIEIMNYWMDLL